MWLLMVFRKAILGFWRLIIGLVIGAVLYIWMFFNFKSHWEKIHELTHDFLNWIVAHPYLADYSQWNTLLNLDDKLAFALFIVVGRMIWLLIESIVFSFPYWLMYGRKKKVVREGTGGPGGSGGNYEVPSTSRSTGGDISAPTLSSKTTGTPQEPPQAVVGADPSAAALSAATVAAARAAEATSKQLAVDASKPIDVSKPEGPAAESGSTQLNVNIAPPQTPQSGSTEDPATLPSLEDVISRIKSENGGASGK